MAVCERCGEENPSYATTCRNCGKYFIDEQTIKIAAIVIAAGVGALTAYWGELDAFVGGVVTGLIVIYIGVRVARVDFTSFVKTFQAAVVWGFLGIVFTKTSSILSLGIILVLPITIKVIYNTTWKKAIVTCLVIFGVVLILFVVLVVIAVILFGWASQF
jgi:hypothetical protein